MIRPSQMSKRVFFWYILIDPKFVIQFFLILLVLEISKMSLVGNIWFEILRLKENASKTKQAFFMQITFTIFSIPFFCPDGTFIKSSTCLTKKLALDYELSKQVSTYSSWPWIRWHLRPWLTRTRKRTTCSSKVLVFLKGKILGDGCHLLWQKEEAHHSFCWKLEVIMVLKFCLTRLLCLCYKCYTYTWHSTRDTGDVCYTCDGRDWYMPLGANDEYNICLKLVVLVSNTRLLAA